MRVVLPVMRPVPETKTAILSRFIASSRFFKSHKSGHCRAAEENALPPCLHILQTGQTHFVGAHDKEPGMYIHFPAGAVRNKVKEHVNLSVV